MTSSLAVFRRACLVLALLAALGGPASAQCQPPNNLSPFNFGAVALGSSATLSFDLTCVNPSGCFPLMATIVGPNASDFAVVSNTCGPGVVPPGPCAITVRFTPSVCGARVAFLVVEGGGCVLFIVPLVGVGGPVVGPPLTFPSTLAGTMGACVTLTKTADITASIVGPGNFTITAQTATTVTVCFTPLAAACGTVTSTLIFTSNLTNCPMASFNLSGFACSFECAIGLAGSASLSAGGRKCILESLGIASTATGALRCVWLECAACCARAEVRANRPGAQAVLDQINCLLAFFGCTGDLFVCQ